MYDQYSLSRLPTTVELSLTRCVIRMAVLFLVDNNSLNFLTFYSSCVHKNMVFLICPTVLLERFALLLFYSIRNMNQVSKCLCFGSSLFHLHSSIPTRTVNMYNISKTIKI